MRRSLLLSALLLALALPSTARAGSDLEEGNLLIRGQLGVDFTHVTAKVSGTPNVTAKGLNLILNPMVDYLVMDGFSIGGYLRGIVRYNWAGDFDQGAATGLIEVGPRLTGWLPILGQMYVLVGLSLGYAHTFVPGTDGNGLAVGPEIGLALPIDTFIGYVALGYTFYWVRTSASGKPKQDELVHQVPLMLGFGGKF